MKERPILFSGAMVRALLDGSKTQTRRVVTPQPLPETTKVYAIENEDFSATTGWWVCEWLKDGARWTDNREFLCPFGKPGDRLWVRETFAVENTQEYCGREDTPKDGRPIQHHEGYKLIPRYRATEPDTQLIIADNAPDEDAMRWTPSIFMPRWASRITLEIESVRVERVQEISEADAIAEGIQAWIAERKPQFMQCRGIYCDDYHKEQFHDLWDSINSERGFGWDVNPYVWVITFSKTTNDRV